MAYARIDAHHHVWDLTVRPEPWIDPDSMAAIARSFAVDELAPLAASAGVGSTIVVQTLSSLDETRELLALADASPLVSAVTGWADLTSPALADVLTELRAGDGGSALRGIRHQVQDEPDPEWLLRPDVRAGLAHLGTTGLVYELLTTPAQLPAAIRVVDELREVSFVLDHCSKPPIAAGELEPWAAQIRSLAGFPNVTCKLSGLVTEASWSSWSVEALWPYVSVVLDAFGPDRVMFGSDWPVCTLASSYPAWVTAAESLLTSLSEPEREAVWAGTARRVYGLA